ncbi:MAG: S49 family peptidase, partial [Rhodothermales bacterium]
VDYLYSIFVDTVARHRGTSPENVLERMADGKLFVGQQAIDAGLVDGVSTLDQLVEMLSDAGPTHAPAGAARGGVSRETAEQTETTQEESIMDLAELKEKHPELFQAAFDEGKAAGLDEGQSQGAKNERERIKAVRGQSLPGHEALIEKLAFDGETTGDQAAGAVLQAERELRKSKQQARRDDASDLNDVTVTVEQDDPPPTEEPVSLEDKAKAEWDRDAKLRADFEGNFDRYLAYAKASANGRMRVLGGKG